MEAQFCRGLLDAWFAPSAVGGLWVVGLGVPIVAATTAALLLQSDANDAHAAVDALAHVVNSKGRYTNRGQGFHFNTGLTPNPSRGLDPQGIFALLRKVDLDGG
jgi:hypothetical protein